METSLIHFLALPANALIPDITAFMVHSTILCAGALCGLWLLRRRSMASQALVLKTFLLLVLLCPLLMYVLREADIKLVEVAVPVELTKEEVIDTSNADGYLDRILANHHFDGMSKSSIVPLDAGTPFVADNATNETGAAAQNDIGWRTYAYVLLCFVWIGGAMFFAVRMLYGFMAVLFIRLTAKTAEISAYRNGLSVASRYRVPLPRLLRSRYIRSPFLAGIFKPVIILPEEGDISPEIIAHELSHFIRGDCFWKLIGQLVHIVVPLQPLVLLLNRRFEDISDYISDDFVVENKFDPRQYAFALVKYAEYATSFNSGLTPAVRFISPRSGLRSRVERILSTSARRRLVNGKAAILGIGCLGVALTLSIATVTFEATVISLPYVSTQVAESVRLPQTETAESVPDVEQNDTEITEKAGITEPGDQHTDEPEIQVAHNEVNAGEPEIGISDTPSEPTAPIENVAATDDEFSVDTVTDDISEPGSGIATSPVQEYVAELPAEQDVVDDYSTEDVSGMIAMLTYPDDSSLDHQETMAPEPVDIEDQMPSVSETLPEVEENVMESDIAYLVKQQPPVISEENFDLTPFHTYDECMIAGQEMFDNGRFFIALKLFKRAAGFRPGDPEVNFHIGNTYLKTADLQKAQMFLKMAIAQDPNHDKAHLRLGDTIKNLGDLRGAWEEYKIAGDLNPALLKEKKNIF